MKPTKKDLEETIKDKVFPLLEETMERSWGLSIPKLGSDLSDHLKNPYLDVYVPPHLPFAEARKRFKHEFLKRELRLHLGNISNLAKKLGVDRRSIHRTVKELDINIDKIRGDMLSDVTYRESVVDQTIRQTLDHYKEIILPEKMEKLYQEVPHLSRNIAKVLPLSQVTWREAEKEFEHQFLINALKDNKGNIAQTAVKIKIRPETLYRKVKKLGLREE